ncbi:ferredoxin [Mycobacterium sp.]|uniref:ferredoxin n=1 Tax=Mycobacterium sp. TaxID=1785 RepID=UPI003F971EBA
MSGEWTVEVDRQACVGNKMCIAAAPDLFDFVDGKSAVRTSLHVPSPELIEAYESCPVSAIVLRDENGQEIEPEA